MIDLPESPEIRVPLNTVFNFRWFEGSPFILTNACPIKPQGKIVGVQGLATGIIWMKQSLNQVKDRHVPRTSESVSTIQSGNQLAS